MFNNENKLYFIGSQEDLVPFRCGLDQAIAAHYHCIQMEGRDFDEEPWAFEYLMSSANRSQTWADITTMAHNLLSEVREYVEEARNDIQRIRYIYTVFFKSGFFTKWQKSASIYRN